MSTILLIAQALLFAYVVSMSYPADEGGWQFWAFVVVNACLIAFYGAAKQNER
jgi:hypothetical protein